MHLGSTSKYVGIFWFVVGVSAPFAMMHLALLALAFPLSPLSWQPLRRVHKGTIPNPFYSGKFVRFSRKDDKSPRNPNDIVNNNGDEEVEWRNLIDGVQVPFHEKQRTQPNARNDPLMGYTYEDLNRYAESASTNGGKLSMDHFPRPAIEEEEEFGVDAIFLEPDAYLQLSRDSFHLDDLGASDSNPYKDPYDTRYHEPMQGYLEAISVIPEDAAFTSAGKTEDTTKDSNTIDDLWSMIGDLQQRQRNSSGSALAEELHHQIFQDEAAFRNQSSVFLQSLTNTSKATEANVERRGRRFRSRQEEAMLFLNQQIEEMEALLSILKQKPNTKQGCSQCNSILSEEELNRFDSSTDTNAICRVCYMEELLTKSKRNEMDRVRNQQLRARTALQSYRQLGNMPKNTKSVNAVRSYRNVPNGENTHLRSRPSVEADLPQSTSSTVPLGHSADNPGKYPNVAVAQANDTAVNLSALQNTTIEPIPILETSTMSESIHPWIEMIDPDTDEIFYWNEETEEMRLEL